MPGSPLIRFEELPCLAGTLGVITLDNPNALNAMNLEMFNSLFNKLREWKKRDEIRIIFIHSTSEKAFCSGGDVKTLALKVREDPTTELPELFFWSEYATDLLIHSYPKPIVCWLDGITMGGGLGITAGASHKIVTEKSVLAMPELNIGFFPDVGAAYFLSQLPESVALFLAWTGARLNGADALNLKLADICLPSKMKEAILHVITQAEWSDSTEENHWRLSNILGGSEVEMAPSNILAVQDILNRDFNATTREDALIKYLGANTKDGWLKKNLENFRRSSPLSAHITYEHFKRMRGLSSERVLAHDWSLAVNLVRKGDFLEGIRAALIDKTNDAKWKHAGFGNVPESEINSLMAARPEEAKFFAHLKSLGEG